MLYFGGVKICQDYKVYTREILGDKEHTHLDKDWNILDNLPELACLKNLSCFSCVTVENVIYIYGGVYEPKNSTESRNLNCYVIELDPYNLSAKVISNSI